MLAELGPSQGEDENQLEVEGSQLSLGVEVESRESEVVAHAG